MIRLTGLFTGVVLFCWAGTIGWAAIEGEEAAPAAPGTESEVQPEAQPEAPPEAQPEAKPESEKFLVLIPEQIDSEWFWFYYSETAQHLVQSAVEKALISGGFEVVDPTSVNQLQEAGSIATVTSTEFARRSAGAAGAAYAIVGQATAVKASLNSAYGVEVVRSHAEITAKIVRVSDGKVMAVEEASADSGGQAQRAAGQAALKKAAGPIARKIVTAVRNLDASE